MWDASEELLEQIGTDKEDIEKCTCLTEEQILMYTQGDGYGWHISDLVIYEKPKELSEFTGLRKTKFGYAPIVARPPQSWCYVEEVQT